MSIDNDDDVSTLPHTDINDVGVVFVGNVVDDTGDDERKDEPPTHFILKCDLLVSVAAVVVKLGISSSFVATMIDDDVVIGVVFLTKDIDVGAMPLLLLTRH
jgi:hypothetical protein